MKYNSLEEALNMGDSYTSRYKLPFRRSDLFKKNTFDLEHFNMTFGQRIMAFFSCLVMALVAFVYSFFNIMGAVFSPTKFALPYAISNYLFFWMFGFLFGFKTYIKKTLSVKKRFYTLAFLSCTLLNLYSGLFLKKFLLSLLLSFLQIGTFFAFVVVFLPGGTNGMTSMLNLMFKR